MDKAEQWAQANPNDDVQQRVSGYLWWLAS